MTDLPPDHPLLQLFHQLRRRNFALGPDDLVALYDLLREGHAWTSRIALRGLCRALWAKSYDEQVVLDALFEQIVQDRWHVAPAAAERVATAPGAAAVHDGSDGEPAALAPAAAADADAPEVMDVPGRLPPVQLSEALLSTAPLILVPQHPVSFRAAAQAWRRLRRPVRFGPAVELDLEGTIARRATTGVAAPPVLRPRRRNTARVMLLVDRGGSMAPFADSVAGVTRAILQFAQLAGSSCYYFHDVPAEDTNDAALEALPRDTLFPAVDSVLAQLRPARHGWLHRDPALLEPEPLEPVLRTCAAHAVIIVSDAGAARGRYDAIRVLDSLALARAVRQSGGSCVWINPLPPARWRSTTAGEIARHLAMFPLDRDGMYQAVNHLRSQLMAPRSV